MKKIPIVIATIMPWNIDFFAKWMPPDNFDKYLISKKEDLTYTIINKIKPMYVFFPHWSWLIPQEIYSNYECVIFHMTDLPFGRGGSPLQNLIVRGIYKTKISAIRAVKEVDTGPIYLKDTFNIGKSSAQELYERANVIESKMIKRIIMNKINPKPQRGAVTVFKRRTPEESKIPARLTLRQLYDFIRMLDAQGYPSAFITYGRFKLEFKKANLANNILTAETTIKINEDEQE